MAPVCAPPQLLGQDRIADIVENVRANEELYENVEVIGQKKYRLGQLKYFHDKLLKSADATARCVYQNGLIFFRNDELQHRLDGQSHRVDTLQGYDGEYTRVVEQHTFANLHHGRFEDARLVRPHTILLHTSFVCFPLSRYLGGSEALKGDPAAGNFAHWDLKLEFVGEETVNGLPCLKLRSTTRAEHESEDFATTRFLWLAPERNYLPVKVECCAARPKGISIPMAIGRAEDFREIGAGVWLPFRASSVLYDKWRYKEDNELVLAWSEEYTIEKAELDPNYDISLFRDIRFPNDIPVYVVKNGRIVKSYYHGEHGDIMPTTRRRWLLWAVLGGIVGLLATAGIVYYRFGRRPWLGLWTRISHRGPHA